MNAIFKVVINKVDYHMVVISIVYEGRVIEPCVNGLDCSLRVKRSFSVQVTLALLLLAENTNIMETPLQGVFLVLLQHR